MPLAFQKSKRRDRSSSKIESGTRRHASPLSPQSATCGLTLRQPMNDAKDKKQIICQVLNHKAGRFALVGLPSGEQIVISIGSVTAKILAKRAVVGWYLPKVVAFERLSTWQSEYPHQNSFHRGICRGLVLEGLLALLSNCQSVDEIRQAWPRMENPLAVVGRAMVDMPGSSHPHNEPT